jgi:hypothetical protein
MGAAEELNKPSPFGQEEGKWTALRNDLNGNLEAIVQEVQVHHLDLGGKNLQEWTDSSWGGVLYRETSRAIGRLETNSQRTGGRVDRHAQLPSRSSTRTVDQD